MSRRRLLRFVVFAALVVAPAAAAPPYAPDDQYLAFTSTDTEISDRKTGLVWQRGTFDEPERQADAIQACANVGRRLPTIKELLTLVNEEPDRVYEDAAVVTKLIDRNAFGTFTPVFDSYWSSTPGLTIDFRTGLTKAGVSSSEPHLFRCVRKP